MEDGRWTLGRENDGCYRMTTHGRWTMDAGQRERRLSKMTTLGRWTMEDGRWAERTTVAEE